MKTRRPAWGRTGLLGVTVVLIILPLVWMILASFGVQPDPMRRPPTWTWPPTLEHYFEVVVLVPGFLEEFEHSLLVASLATALAVCAAFLSAYALARLHFSGKRLVVQSFLVLATLPVISYAIPLGEIARRARLHDTIAGMVLADAAVFAPLAVYILYGYVARLSPELEDAARLEGATLLKVLWTVIAPATAQGLAATTVLIFVLNWNFLLVPLTLAIRVKTVPIAVIDFFTFEREVEWSTAAAALVVSLLPAVILVTVAYRMLEQFSLGPLRRPR